MVEIYHDQDGILLRKISEGNAQAFNTLYERYWEVVFTSAFKRLNNRDKAKDITQDIFANLWMKREALQIENLPAYLYTSVRNRVLNLFEKEKRYIPFEQLLSANLEFYGERADAVALRHEFLNAYKALVESLPLQRRKIFKYYYDEGLSTEEIARKLGLSRKTVQNQLGTAVTHLRANLSHLFFLMILLGTMSH